MNHSTLLKELSNKLPSSKSRVAMASGMWIIEAVVPSLIEANRKNMYQIISDCVNTSTPGENIWKIFLYAKDEERFSIEATLHTTPRKYSEDGFVTVTLAANDCFLLITEFDCEVLQMDRPKPFLIEGLEYKNAAGNKIMPFQEMIKSNYQNIEFMGMMFNFDGSKIKKDSSTGLIQIEI